MAVKVSLTDRILYEDEYLLVVHKPAGVDAQSTSSFEPDMVSLLKNELKKRGVRNPYIGVVHRLDKPVEGLLLYAKSREMTADLCKEISDRNVHKEYFALCDGIAPEQETVLENMLGVDRETHTAYVAEAGNGLKPARLSYCKVEADDPRVYKPYVLQQEKLNRRRELLGESKRNTSLVRIMLYTGRFHQIRCQLAHAGHPIVGDRRYGQSEADGLPFPALCAVGLTFTHPITKQEMSFSLVE